MKQSKILIIGGSNIDYLAKSNHTLIMEDSNIGTLTTSFGGVGRNITENLARLKDDVTFITGIGKDAYGQSLKEKLEELNVNVLSVKSKDPSGSYVSIADEKGNMTVAICDTRLMDNMTIDDILEFKDVIEENEVIVLEANLNEDVIDGIFRNFPNHRFYIEGVSANKIRRFRNHLPQISLFKCNVLEAEHFLDVKKKPTMLAYDLLSLGCKNVVLSNGKAPIIIGTEGKVEEIPVVSNPNVVSVNGAGDALFAGIVHELSLNKTLEEAVSFGNKMAFYTLLSDTAIQKDIYNLMEKEEK